jgi:hypothetical protein
MDVMTLTDDGQNAQIGMSAESRLVDFRRVREVRYTHEEQQAIDPTDKGLEFVNGIQEKTIYWGDQNPNNRMNDPPPGEIGPDGLPLQ